MVLDDTGTVTAKSKPVPARRLSWICPVLLAGLMAVSFAIFGSVSPRAPQVIGNAGYQKLWAGDVGGAVTEFERALKADPAFPYRWSDLGEALADDGKIEEARYCFRRAVELAPGSPQIAVRAANFWFRTGSIEEGLSIESKVLGEVPDFDQMIFRSWVRMAGGVRRMLDTGIGTNARAARAFFDFMIANGSRTDLDEVWRWMETRGYVVRQQSRERVDVLLRSNETAEAAEVWNRHVAIDPGQYRSSDWIDNGGFEKDWTGGGFDWNSVASPGVNVAADGAVAHDGKRSLRLDINSDENLDFHHFFQRTWMPPGRYRLEGWVRASGFSTDQGIGLRAWEPGHESELNAFTPTVFGTRDWERVAQDFTVAGRARMVEIQVVRRPSLDFDNHPHGTAWIDDIHVRRLP